MADQIMTPTEKADEEIPSDRTLESIRPVTRELISSLMMDVWPSPAACVDFGIRSPEHLGALQYAVLTEGVTAEELDAALGKGPALQALIGSRNPYRSVVFTTDWDDLPQEPEDDL